ncbi:uncharacterized protein LOC131152967 [Malania oleifera]|uniref:uncharacterized protein LOC131152967 n=1 Tax=Malania oleifera TaxID=397392 RepID=UPI0025ADE3F4|nr:uncharacterized protein LOC131152967 [Malania oleifera]
MGNCLVLQKKTIKIVKMDGKVLEYKAPMKVHQVLQEFPGHAVADRLPVLRHLLPDAEMLSSHLYYLLPLSMPSPDDEKKKVRFLNTETEGGQRTAVVRIKLVISKQELKEMLRKGGASIDDITSHLQDKQNKSQIDTVDDDRKGNRVWKPVLESIPEVN